MTTSKIFYPHLSAELMKVKRQVKSFHSDYTDSQAWLSLNISRTNFYNVYYSRLLPNPVAPPSMM